MARGPMQAASSTTENHRPWAKSEGDEPLPGYRLLEPLGRGGFGEVWKCEAPGGLHKAVKFVAPDPEGGPRAGDCLRQEFDAFQQIKKIRHPFLLTLERVEMINGEMVSVMELADRHLFDRYVECVAQGEIGIPRDELLSYFADAAEALDLITEDYQLQHLDIKPANLFLVGRHVKVGDYGLVSKLDPTGSDQEASRANRGLTPRYAAPEVLRGRVDANSDQYSLALVYFELLTGEFPYTARTPQQMLLQHVTATPNLKALPEGDRPAIARALSKVAADRFPSCLAFVQGLLAVPTAEGQGDHVRRARVDRIVSQGHRIDPSPTTKGQTSRTDTTPTAKGRSVADPSPTARGRVQETPHVTLRAVPSLTVPGRPLPSLTVPNRTAMTPPPVNYQQIQEEEADELLDLVLAATTPVQPVVLQPIRGVVPVGRLTGNEPDPGALDGSELIAALLGYVTAGGHSPQVPGDLGRLADGTWTDTFPATQVAATASFKLAVLREEWGCEQIQTLPNVIVLRRNAPSGGLWGKFSGGKGAGLEIEVRLPAPGKPIGEVRILGRLFGTPDRTFAGQSETAIPQMIREVRRVLQNVDDRRRSPRFATDMPVTVYPIHEDGRVQPGFAGKCRDLSAGGVSFIIDRPAPTRYAYLTFDAVRGYEDYAILVALIRANPAGQQFIAGGRFRTDI